MYALLYANWRQRFLSAGLATQSNLGTGLTRPWHSIHLRARLLSGSSAPAGRPPSRLLPPPPLLLPAALLPPALRPVIDVGYVRPARYRRLLTREGQVFRTAVVSALLVSPPASSLVGSAAWLALAGSTLGPPIVAVIVAIRDGTLSVPDDLAGKFDAAVLLAVEMSWVVGTRVLNDETGLVCPVRGICPTGMGWICLHPLKRQIKKVSVLNVFSTIKKNWKSSLVDLKKTF